MFLLELTINISGLNLKRTTLEINFCLNISENLERDHAREFVRGTLVSATQVSATLRPVMRVKSCDLRTKVNGPSGVFRAWPRLRLVRAYTSCGRAHKSLRDFRRKSLRDFEWVLQQRNIPAKSSVEQDTKCTERFFERERPSLQKSVLEMSSASKEAPGSFLRRFFTAVFLFEKS